MKTGFVQVFPCILVPSCTLERLQQNTRANTYSEPCQTPRMERFVTNRLKILFIQYSLRREFLKINSLMTESLSYRNQSTDFFCKSMDWFLYDTNLRHERVKGNAQFVQSKTFGLESSTPRKNL